MNRPRNASLSLLLGGLVLCLGWMDFPSSLRISNNHLLKKPRLNRTIYIRPAGLPRVSESSVSSAPSFPSPSGELPLWDVWKSSPCTMNPPIGDSSQSDWDSELDQINHSEERIDYSDARTQNVSWLEITASARLDDSHMLSHPSDLLQREFYIGLDDGDIVWNAANFSWNDVHIGRDEATIASKENRESDSLSTPCENPFFSELISSEIQLNPDDSRQDWQDAFDWARGVMGHTKTSQSESLTSTPWKDSRHSLGNQLVKQINEENQGFSRRQNAWENKLQKLLNSSTTKQKPILVTQQPKHEYLVSQQPYRTDYYSLMRDSRHSQGLGEVLQINSENDGHLVPRAEKSLTQPRLPQIHIAEQKTNLWADENAMSNMLRQLWWSRISTDTRTRLGEAKVLSLNERNDGLNSTIFDRLREREIAENAPLNPGQSLSPHRSISSDASAEEEKPSPIKNEPQSIPWWGDCGCGDYNDYTENTDTNEKPLPDLSKQISPSVWNFWTKEFADFLCSGTSMGYNIFQGFERKLGYWSRQIDPSKANLGALPSTTSGVESRTTWGL